ncbi:MAG: hypothetical protein JSR80_03205, partial [Verrucomicrobia bacterium]|nr:hypothetical protein [Verrucomicrobiota bacterium]
MFSSSFISLWLAYATGIGIAVAYFGLGLNILLGVPFWQGKRWAKSALLWRYLLNLVWAGALLLFLNDPIASALETAASVSMIALLAITPSTRAAFSVLTVYCTLLAVVALGMYQMVQRQDRMTAIVMEAGKPPRYESSFQYHLSLGGLPWKVLRKSQAMQLLGQNIP